ncbi:conserved hypothetical protein [delta proteobacterium NaphS2]|nr:conserved hypothetical protein [delta proteobacterium NaphS2]
MSRSEIILISKRKSLVDKWFHFKGKIGITDVFETNKKFIYS